MTFAILAASLAFTAPITADSLRGHEPRYRLDLQRYLQSRTWACCLRHDSSPERWRELWPKVRMEAHGLAATGWGFLGGRWTRHAHPRQTVRIDSLPPGAYRWRWCSPDTCRDWSGWRSIR